jgi:hypothetical protein
MINSLKVLLEQSCPDRVNFIDGAMAMGQTRGLGLTGIITEQSCVCNMTTGGLNHVSWIDSLRESFESLEP